MVRVGVIADIHANLFALDAALAELKWRGVDEIVCLGDVASLGPQPAATLDRLREIGCPVVMGNTDAWLLDPPPMETADESDRATFALNAWCAAQLTPAHLAYIASFPPTWTLTRDGTTALFFHGSPRSYDDIITATTPDADVDAMCKGLDAMCAGLVPALFVGGHTHIPLVRRYRDGRLLNPGSVGLPGVGAGPPPQNRNVDWGEYAVFDMDGDRVHSVALHRLPLDVGAMLHIAAECDMPERKWWESKWQ